ncbi:MAG: hypothetical protein K8R87_04585 [Verrucomicrobia bacterium]|nr:hypothetical protein [Verrucomicrobiota bacterium]
MAAALKLGVEELTQITGPSEVGQDHAAYLYATAKRVETEHALAQKNVQLVIELHRWREAIAKSRGSAYTLAYVINGGGTMYTHGHARDCAFVEDFIADLAKRLPLPEGKGDKDAVKVIEDAIALIKKLQPLDVGDVKSQKKAKADLAVEVTRVTEFWTNLKYMIDQVPAEEANRIAAFAAEALGWLREG